LLICLNFQGTYHYKGEIDLRFAKVNDLDVADQPYCFQIITKEGAHTVRARSQEEKTEWISRLKEVIWSLENGHVSSYSDGKRKSFFFF